MNKISQELICYLSLLPACIFVGAGFVDGFSWPIVVGIIASFVIHYAKDLVPAKRTLTSAELAAFQIMHQEVQDLKTKVSALTMRFGFKSADK